MKQQILSSGWMLTIPEDNVYHIGPDPIPATIPGSVYSCLLENSLMPDPYWRDNELDALKLMENDFVYETALYSNMLSKAIFRQSQECLYL